MRKLIPIFVSMMLVASVVIASQPETRRVLGLEHRWLNASMQRDIPVLNQILTDDFIDISWSGRVRTKADVLAAPAVKVKSTQSLSELKVRFYGDTAIVTGIDTTSAADRSFTARIHFTDVFVKRSGRWRAASAQETLERGR